jgi:hypothetical protein
MRIASLALASTVMIAALLVGTTSSTSTTGIRDYNPWCDLDDDGDIDIYDIVDMANRYGTTGTPVNKTELLYNVSNTYTALLTQIASLQTQLDSQNDTLSLLHTWLDANVTKIAELQDSLMILNATKLGAPDYDSEWVVMPAGASSIFTHNLSTTNVLVYLLGKKNGISPYIHQKEYGGLMNTLGSQIGVYWYDLTATTLTVYRHAQGPSWNYVRVMVWKIPEP